MLVRQLRLAEATVTCCPEGYSLRTTGSQRPTSCRRSLAWLIPVHRRAMRVRQEGIHGVADRVEADRMRAAFRRDALKTSHRLGIEDVDDSGIADRDVEVSKRGVAEDDVRHAAERMLALHGARPRIDHEQHLAVACAEETSCRRI